MFLLVSSVDNADSVAHMLDVRSFIQLIYQFTYSYLFANYLLIKIWLYLCLCLFLHYITGVRNTTDIFWNGSAQHPKVDFSQHHAALEQT